MNNNKVNIDDLLSSLKKINYSKLQNPLIMQKEIGEKLTNLLKSEEYVSENEVLEVLELQLGIPYVDLDKFKIKEHVVTLLPEHIARKYQLLPIDKRENFIVVAMSDPLDIFAFDDLKLYLKTGIQPVISTKEKINKAIDKFYSSESTKRVLEEFVGAFNPIDISDMEYEEMLEVTSAPIVKLLNSIVDQAVREKASDIHIEPYKEDLRVRFRIDGDLREVMTLSRNSLSGIVTRIKIIGNMDIAEKRIPQDGRVESIVNGREIDMRISTLPTVYGEKTVIRLLDRTSFNFTKEHLGLSDKDLKIFDNILSQPYGMILVTGPTGSGKTTTLYTVLQELNRVEKNIITIEDPVEYKLKGINQVQTNEKSGLTFARGLRSVLRQDPDIVMVGEIRDSETAEIATRAAITGHLVLSTLHTNDSPSTVARLIDMGIEDYLVSSAVIGVVSQRLVKILCPQCKEEYIATAHEKEVMGMEENKQVKLYRPIGCTACNLGYKGRAAVHEVMPISENIRHIIDKNGNVDEIRNQAIKDGMTTLLRSVTTRAMKGETSFEEVLRIGFTLG